jgi:hypothetical protein
VTALAPAEQVQRLARLAREPIPEETSPKPIVFVRLAAIAQARGVTWAQIAGAIGAPNGAAAKRWAKGQAKLAQREMIAKEVGLAAARETLAEA